jgi:hypothetical protein
LIPVQFWAGVPLCLGKNFAGVVEEGYQVLIQGADIPLALACSLPACCLTLRKQGLAGGGRAAFYMPKIKLDAVSEGMTVAADVKNMDDMLLVPAGCVLTERHIKILRTWGISEVQIDGEEQGSTTLMTIAPDVLCRMEDELRKTFWEFDSKLPVQQEIFKLALRRRARAFLNQSPNAA